MNTFDRSTVTAMVGAAWLLASPLAAQRAAEIPSTPLPSVVSDGRFDVVLLSHVSAAALGQGARISEYYRACRRAISLPASDSLAVIRSHPWDWTTGGTVDPSTFTLLISRKSANEVDCQVPEDVRATAFARGFHVTADTAYPYSAAIEAANIRRGDSIVTPVDRERTASTRITPRGLVVVSGGLVRISIAIDSVAPDSTGRVTDLEIEIVTPDTVLPHRIAIPWSALRPIWEQLLASRSQRAGAEVASANVSLLAALVKPGSNPAQRLDARVRLGTNFASGGDVAAARVVLGHAVAEEPCLTLAAAAPASARAIVDAAYRPTTRCRAHLLQTTAVAAALPGFGHLQTTNRRIYAGAMFGFVAATLAASQSANDDAKRLYAQYLAVDGTDPTLTANTSARLYDMAESKRASGQSLVTIGATAWAASIVEAVWTEYRLQRRLVRVQGYRVSGRAMSAAPHLAPGRVGLALHVF